MNRIESFVIALFLGVGMPLLLLVSCWFCLIAIWMFEIVRLTNNTAIVLLIVSFFAGVIIDILYLKKLTVDFYRTSVTLMIPLYVILSLIAIALCMGVPIGNIVLGILAGVYIGRRHLYTQGTPNSFKSISRKVGFFTSGVTGIVALPVGILALVAGEEYIAKSFIETLGLDYSIVAGLGFVVVLCLVLMTVQYWLTRYAAILGHRTWGRSSLGF